MERQHNHRVVLVPFPYQGHMTPMLQLGAILHAKGFSITVAHADMNSPDPLKHPGFVFQPFPVNLSSSDTSVYNIYSVILDLNKSCKEPLESYMVQLLANEKEHGHIVCIIYDAIFYSVETVAANLMLPSVVLRTGMAASVQPFLYILQLHAENCLPLPESKVQEPVPELPPLFFNDFSVLPTREIREELRDSITCLNGINTSVAVIWNTIDYLEHIALSQLQQHFKVRFFPIGPLHKMAPPTSSSFLEEDLSCIAWLDRQASNSVLYISFGSLAIIDREELVETAWGLANSGQSFLWVIRPSSVNEAERDEHFPEGFRELVGERGQIVKWAPQKQVLAHPAIGGFWSHCGWNSTLESISEGVPMICTPRMGDQRVNARFLTDKWNVGLRIENVKDRGAIETSIRRLMIDNEGKRLRQKMFEMKANIKAAMEKGGSSYMSFIELTEFISSLSCMKDKTHNQYN